MSQWIPNLTGRVDPVVEREIRRLFEYHYATTARLDNPAKVTSLDLRAVVQAISAGGSSPLNLTGLVGQTAQPQIAKVTHVTSLPPIGSNLAQAGVVVELNGIPYFFDASTLPGTWRILGQVVLTGTHVERVENFLPTSYPTNTLFYETDTEILLLNIADPSILYPAPTVGAGNRWIPILAHPVEDTHIRRGRALIGQGRVDTSGTAVTYASGELFSEDMVGKYITIGPTQYIVATFVDTTHITLTTSAGITFNVAYYFSFHPAIYYPKGTSFYETDRTILYLTRDAEGVVDVTGSTVTWASGLTFNAYWVGTEIQIDDILGNPVRYLVQSVESPTSLTLTQPAGPLAAVGYSVIGGEWLYQSGENYNVLLSIPSDLSLADVGLIFNSTDFSHRHLYTLILGFPGWRFHPGDLEPTAIVAGISLPGGTNLWKLCDGTAVSIATAGGSLATVSTPNLTGDVFILGGSPGAQRIATNPTWDPAAKTEDTSPVGTTAANSSSVVVQSGTGTTVANHPHTHSVSGLTHSHDLTNTNAILNPPSEADGGLPKRIGLQWYMRK